MKKLRVLSLFDGMSCGRLALERAGYDVEVYYASEVDGPAIKVTMANWPETVQLGDVRGVDVGKLGWIDLVIGGSPCQSFSFAGKRKGMSTKENEEILTLERYLELREQGFEFEGQSYLFWEYMRVLGDVRKVNPGVKFLLENVMMGEKWQRVLTRAIGIEPIEINSALVSAQNRRMLYWTNIGAEESGFFGDLECKILPPKDRGILLRDVLEVEVDEKYYLSEKAVEGIMKHKEEQKEKGFGFGAVIKNEDEKMNALKCGGKGVDDLVVHNMQPRSGDPKKGGTGHLTRTDGKTYYLDTGNTNAVEIVAMRGRGEKGDIEQKLEANGTGKSNSLTTVQKDNLVRQINPSTESNGCQPYQQNRVYSEDGISPALMAQLSTGSHNVMTGSRIRRLTPVECERLQTVPDNYTNHVSDTQRYRMLGNGWTVDVIAYIFSHLK